MNIFVFDIETIPDTESGRRIHQLHDLDDAEVTQAMFALQRERSQSDFLPLHLHRIVAISIVFRYQQSVKVWSLGNTESTETELIQRFFQGLEKYSPTLVSWNGSGFDLPVLHYRALLHKVTAAQYWETGEHDQNFRWNNYLNRYHYRHLDLMDILAAYQPRACAKLTEIATMLGFPGKMGMSGADVYSEFEKGNTNDIRNYCEIDVLNTYLIYLRFELMRGNLIEQHYQQEIDLLKTYLSEQKHTHFDKFLQAWE